jgi:sugar phosphate isomerase/epimerase
MIASFSQIGVVASALSSDPREAPRLARAAGFAGVQFDAISSALDVTTLSQTGRREFLHVLRSSDQQLVGLRFDASRSGFSDVDRLLDRATQIVEAAKGLAAPLVCIELGALPEPAPEAKSRPRVTQEQAGLIIIPDLSPPPDREPVHVRGPDPKQVAQVDAAMMELGGRADRIGVAVAFRSDLCSFAAIERALFAAACPWFGIDLDPVAALRDEWPPDEIFSRLGPLIRHVRGRDATVGNDRRTRPATIGQGSANWGELLAALDSSGYRGWIAIDPLELTDRAASAIAGAKFIRDAAARR